ncbi:Reticulocyte-binding protein 2 homolog a [Durusdinium trenchii]|uniref:Reticulocyte-binding protein 2 homolog a n=1 Tax=Durusdinium trenchii TaxID=1381693 RepID=A0ABP0L8R2_9DINO
MLRSASFSSMEGSLMASTSCKTLRTSRSMGRLSLSNLSLCASESVENERRQTERGLERESRWLKRALSEEMHRIEAMQEQDAQHEQWRQDRAERQRQVDSRLRQRSLHRWEESCKRKVAEENRQKQESESHNSAFEKAQQRLQADRQAAEARLQEERQRQQKQAQKRRSSWSEMEGRKEAERKEQMEQLQKAHEQQQARDQVLRATQDKRQQQICAKKEQRAERMQKLLEAQRELEEQRLARYEEKQRLHQHNSGAFSARQRVQHDKTQSTFKELQARRAEARSNADLQKERRRSDMEQKAAQKSQKLENMNSDRQKLWEIRKTAHREAARILRDAKKEVHRQAMSSRYSVKWLQEQMGQLENEGLATSLPISSTGSSSASIQDQEEPDTRCAVEG